MISSRSSTGSPSEVERDLVAEPRLDVAVQAVVGDVERAADVPLRIRKVPLQKRRERLEPRDPLATLALPELLERDFVDVRLRVRLRREVGWWRIAPVLGEQRLDRLVRHAMGSRSYGQSVRRS